MKIPEGKITVFLDVFITVVRITYTFVALVTNNQMC